MDSLAFARRIEILFGADGILWFRGYVTSDTLESQLDDVLEEFGTRIHVIAHTPLESIQARYDGKILAVDLERAATEMLLLEWDAGGERYRRWRIGLDGPPEQF